MGLFRKLFGEKTLLRIARKAGYVKDQNGIQNRFVRESTQWQSHLNNTKKYIVDTILSSPQHCNIAILGSGWLFDVPIDELSNTYSNVDLYDIVHPEQIVVKMNKYKNVHLKQIDLTGGAVSLAEKARSLDEFLLLFSTIQLPDFSQYDCVVSVNLLNQLDIILCDYLIKKFKVQESQLLPIRTVIQQRHIDMLPKGKTCLITDYCEGNKSVDTSKEETKSLIYCTLPQGNNVEEWIWHFDTNQMYHKGWITTMKVRAMRI